MGALPISARLIWAAVVGLGSSALVIAVYGTAGNPIPWETAVPLFLAGIAFDSLRLRFSYERVRNNQFGTLSSAVHVASALLLPPAIAVTVVASSFVAAAPFRRVAWYKEVFNLAQTVLAVGLTAFIWQQWGSGSGRLDELAHASWLVVALVVYFVINSGLVSLIVAAADGLPLGYVWLRSHQNILPTYLGLLLAGALIAHLWSVSPWSTVLVLGPMVAAYYAFKRTFELEHQTLEAMFNLADILDARDPYTHEHSLRVGHESEKLALRLGLPADEAYLIYLCGRLHDLGKCAVDNEVLRKPGPLTDEERQHMSCHAEVGGEMISHFGVFRQGASYVRGHHEWYNGSGYPDRLKEDSIPLGARVIAVADAFDAMTSDRPYRKALPLAEAIRRLREGRGIQWEPAIVDAYVEMVEQRGVAPRPELVDALERVPTAAGAHNAGR